MLNIIIGYYQSMCHQIKVHSRLCTAWKSILTKQTTTFTVVCTCCPHSLLIPVHVYLYKLWHCSHIWLNTEYAFPFILSVLAQIHILLISCHYSTSFTHTNVYQQSYTYWIHQCKHTLNLSCVCQRQTQTFYLAAGLCISKMKTKLCTCVCLNLRLKLRLQNGAVKVCVKTKTGLYITVDESAFLDNQRPLEDHDSACRWQQ